MNEGSTTTTMGTSVWETGGMTTQYMSLQDVADHLGVSRNTVAKLRLPDPDVIVGSDLNARRGWSVASIDAWNAQRPGKGWRAGQVAAPAQIAGSKGKK